MPFEGAPRPEAPQITPAVQSWKVLDMMQSYFEPDGRKWIQLHELTPDGRCLVGALEFARRSLHLENDCAAEYLVRVLRPWRWRSKPRTLLRILTKYNDARGRSFADIAALLASAKALAEAEMGAGTQRSL